MRLRQNVDMTRAAVVVGCVVAQTCAAAPLFGTLMSNSAAAAAEFNSGLRQVGHECFWNRMELADGVWNPTEIAWKQKERDAFLAAGMSLVLEPGLHEPPAYVSGLPNAAFVSQTGATSGMNVIWSTDVRARVERYIRKLASVLDFSKYYAIRLGGAGDVEVLYPGSNLFWAYDPVAQAACPYPGWAPGNASLTTAQVTAWYAWYLDSLIGEIAWRRDLFRSLNFTGAFHLVMPGVGAVPIVAQAALASGLTQYADVMGRGAAWYDLLSRLTGTMGAGGLVAWCSSTAESLRQNDTTQPGDAGVDPLSPELNAWSSMRLMTYNADRLGLGKGGENPGYGDSPGYGVPMLDAAVAQVRAGNWSAFSWAHDADLYNGTHGINLTDYAAAIANFSAS